MFWPRTKLGSNYRSIWKLFICLALPLSSAGASGKESTCQCRRHKRCRFDPWVGKIPWRRAWTPTLLFLPGESHGQRNLADYGPWGHKESDMTAWLSMTYFHFSSVAESCLILCDPMDCSTPGLRVHHQLPELAQTHVHRVGDAVQPSRPLSSPSPPTLNLSQHHKDLLYSIW